MLSAAATLVFAVVSAAPGGSRYADAAPPGFSGGFGEPSCHACHFHAELNSGPGRVTVSGAPERFTAGARYPLTITLSRPGMKLGGLQLTVRFKDDGAQAGVLAADAGDRDRVRIDVQRAVQYVNQRREGTRLGSSSTAVWKLIWTAPPARGPVVFHATANAADGDETVEGDFVHTSAVESAPMSTTPAPRQPARTALFPRPIPIQDDPDR